MLSDNIYIKALINEFYRQNPIKYEKEALLFLEKCFKQISEKKHENEVSYRPDSDTNLNDRLDLRES